MIPVLFEKNETAFTSNGIGRLSDALTCVVSETRNGAYELKMTYPVNGAHYTELAHSRIIFAQPAEGKANQAFRIHKITKPANGRITVLAQHISYQLSSVPVSPFEASTASGALAGLVSNAAVSQPFTVWTDVSASGTFKLNAPESFKAAIGGMTDSILETYGGEMEWDMYDVKLHAARGTDRGKIVSYGKNITSISQEENISKVITGIYPFYGGDEYMELPEKILTVATEETYPYQRIEKLDLTRYFTGTPTEEELRAKAQEYLSKTVLGVPQLTIKASFVDEENHVPVYLCDTVTVLYAPLNISIRAKVTKIDYNVLLERYEAITIGVVKDSIIDAVLTQEKNAEETESQIKQVAQVAKEQTAAVAEKVEEITYDYVLPQVERTDAISAGGDAIVLEFYFNLASAARVRFGATINFETTKSGTDLVHLHVIYNVDDTPLNPSNPLVEYYDDGYHILTLDFLTEELAAGSHTFGVAFGVTGGTLS